MCKINQLHRDLPLLVIHRHHHVVFAADRTHEDGIWIIRPVYEYPGRSSRFDCGNDSFGILNSKQAMLPSMGINATHGDARMFTSQESHRFDSNFKWEKWRAISSIFR